MKKQMYIAFIVLYTIATHAANEMLINLSKAIAPITRTVSAPEVAEINDEQLNTVISALRKSGCKLDALTRMPITESQFCKPFPGQSVCAFNQDCQSKLAYMKHISKQYPKNTDHLAGGKYPVVGRYFNRRYIPLIHIINTNALPEIGEYDSCMITSMRYTIKPLGNKGHDAIGDQSNTHYYDFLRLLLDFNQLKEFDAIASQFSANNLSSNARLCDTFLMAQSRIEQTRNDLANKLIEKIEPIFTEKSIFDCIIYHVIMKTGNNA